MKRVFRPVLLGPGVATFVSVLGAALLAWRAEAARTEAERQLHAPRAVYAGDPLPLVERITVVGTPAGAAVAWRVSDRFKKDRGRTVQLVPLSGKGSGAFTVLEVEGEVPPEREGSFEGLAYRTRAVPRSEPEALLRKQWKVPDELALEYLVVDAPAPDPRVFWRVELLLGVVGCLALLRFVTLRTVRAARREPDARLLFARGEKVLPLCLLCFAGLALVASRWPHFLQLQSAWAFGAVGGVVAGALGTGLGGLLLETSDALLVERWPFSRAIAWSELRVRRAFPRTLLARARGRAALALGVAGEVERLAGFEVGERELVRVEERVTAARLPSLREQLRSGTVPFGVLELRSTSLTLFGEELLRSDVKRCGSDGEWLWFELSSDVVRRGVALPHLTGAAEALALLEQEWGLRVEREPRRTERRCACGRRLRWKRPRHFAVRGVGALAISFREPWQLRIDGAAVAARLLAAARAGHLHEHLAAECRGKLRRTWRVPALSLREAACACGRKQVGLGTRGTELARLQLPPSESLDGL